MKNTTLVLVHIACAAVLFAAACNPTPGKLKGEWKSADTGTRLTITDDKFIEDNGTPVSEDYFLKGDTIFTSFEGNLPYTKFVIQQMNDQHLILLYPDSVMVSFTR